jgi:hypothetical protein
MNEEASEPTIPGNVFAHEYSPFTDETACSFSCRNGVSSSPLVLQPQIGLLYQPLLIDGYETLVE